MTIDSDLRLEALDRSVRVSLASGGHETTEAIVKRARAFTAFLHDEKEPN